MHNKCNRSELIGYMNKAFKIITANRNGLTEKKKYDPN